MDEEKLEQVIKEAIDLLDEIQYEEAKVLDEIRMASLEKTGGEEADKLYNTRQDVNLRDFDTRVDTGKSEVFNTPNDDGYVQKWLVNIIFQTDTGIVDKESPTHKKFLTMPHAEFYSLDTNQFVSAYYVETLLEDAPGLSAEGLDLHGGVPVWSIDGKGMTKILNWLRSVVKDVEAPEDPQST